jgi:hypothetical protein
MLAFCLPAILCALLLLLTPFISITEVTTIASSSISSCGSVFAMDVLCGNSGVCMGERAVLCGACVVLFNLFKFY